MKFAFFILLVFFACNADNEPVEQAVSDDPNEPETPIEIPGEEEESPEHDYRADMRSFVIKISDYAKGRNGNFAVIPQNGLELLTLNGNPNGNVATDYLQAIDANGQEDLFYGYSGDDVATPGDVTSYLTQFLNISNDHGNRILVIDYCTTLEKIADARKKSQDLGYLSFVATERDLTNIPELTGEPSKTVDRDINRLQEAQNFLFFINYQNFNSKSALIDEIAATDYDLVILDLFYNDGTAFSSEDIARMRTKADGSPRLVCCYMSIGEAEEYRYYWQTEWKDAPPAWLSEENPDWKGNHKVQYWDPEWQAIILGDEDAYLDRILNAGFDGVYLDIIDAFEYFENQ